MDYVGKIKRKRNPRETANLLSLLTFGYTTKLFYKTLKKDLEEEDLYEVTKPCRSGKCANKIEKEWNSQKEKGNKPSVAKLLWSCYGWHYIFLGFLHLLWKSLTTVLEPLAIGKLVSYFVPHQTDITFDDALWYAAILIFLKAMHCFYFQNYAVFLQQLGIQIRTAFCSLIYRKSLRLTPAALSEISVGNIITIMTKDVGTFEQSIYLLNDFWIEAIRSSLAIYLIYDKVGDPSWAGIGILILVLPFHAVTGRIVRSIRMTINKKTDDRLQITQETLSAIRIIKMYTWEKLFNNKVDESRKKEAKQLMKAQIVKMMMVVSGTFASKIGFYVLIIVYIWFNSVVKAEVIFYVMECYKDLRHSLGIIIPMGLGRFAELTASVSRMNKVLHAEELENADEELPAEKLKINIKDASVCIQGQDILKDITWKPSSGLTVVTGPLGCGKSSFLKLCLNDYSLSSGTVISEGTISYSSQDPWLFPSTIRQNILFGQEYDEKRYNDVVRVCALQYDFSLFENGDQTIVADRGLNLSRGQQCRINLARAVYKDSEMYLLDDPLNALDPKIQEFVFNNCINGYLRDRHVVLVTHNKTHIKQADNVLILNKGMIKFDGKSEEGIENILEEIEEELHHHHDESDKDEDDEPDESTKLICKEDKNIYKETKKQGKVDFKVYKRYLKFGGGYCLFMIIFTLSSVVEFTDSFASKLITMWINLQESMGHKSAEIATNSTFINATETKSNNMLHLYSVMVFTSCFTEVIKVVCFLNFTRKASVNIHKAMIKTLTGATMAFYDTYFIGNILNRFSQDLMVVDEQLPQVLNSFFWIVFAAIGIIALISSVNWMFIIPCALLIVILILLRIIYMPTARSLKRLESAMRSPLVGHLNASVEGITTVRAAKAQRILEQEFDKHQDMYTSAHFTSFCVKRAFAFFMDIVSLTFIAIVITKFMFFDTGEEAGNVGLAISKSSALVSIVQWGLVQWSELENTMTSTERVLEYTNLPQETYSGQKVEHWPSEGKVKYKNVSLTYTNSHEKCLKNISFEVGAGRKVGIVGRTGAGKSSIISTLFRLYDFEGTVWIDDVNTKTLSLEFLREHISIIPQDPVLFKGTIRENIDPFKKYTDEEIWNTIEKVKMKDLITSLSTEITDHGANFSTGQRQLLCLARAVIRKNKIVVLDEATANMDPDTEKLVHEAIVENFWDCTVFIIAHRLKSVLDCNRIMVLERGEIKEFEDPVILSENKNSLFYKMLKSSGSSYE